MVWKKCRMVAAVRTTVVLEPMAKDLPQAFPPTVQLSHGRFYTGFAGFQCKTHDKRARMLYDG